MLSAEGVLIPVQCAWHIYILFIALAVILHFWRLLTASPHMLPSLPGQQACLLSSFQIHRSICSCFLATPRAVHTDSMLQTNCNSHFPVTCHYPTQPRNHSLLPSAFWLWRINLLHLHQTSIIFPILTRRRFLKYPSVSRLCASVCLAVGLTD